MKTIDLEIALMDYFRYTQNLCVPNVTTLSHLVGFEVDLLILTKANFAYAVEIKVSKGDLKNDLNKPHIACLNSEFGKAAFDKKYNGLKHFYYCVPDFLYQDALEQIPSFCGLLIAKQYAKSEKTIISEYRKPKQIFNTKWSNFARHDLMRLAAMRIYTLKNQIKHCKTKI